LKLAYELEAERRAYQRYVEESIRGATLDSILDQVREAGGARQSRVSG
jgi:hypothetical protein